MRSPPWLAPYEVERVSRRTYGALRRYLTMKTFTICALLVAMRFLPDLIAISSAATVASPPDPQRAGPPRWFGTSPAVVVLR